MEPLPIDPQGEVIRPPPVRCKPAFWGRGGHVQTLLGHLLTRGSPEDLRPGSEFADGRVRLRDGDQLLTYTSPGQSDVVVYLMHGLGGSTASSYMRRTARALSGAGHTVVAVNHRGSGGIPGLHHLPYQTGRISDLEDLLRSGQREHPGQRLIVVGFSLSGNTLLKHLALSKTLPDAAIAVNPPVDLESTSLHLLRGFRRLYDFRILQSCRRWVPQLRGRNEPMPRYRVPVFSSLREFDRLYIAPVSGFRDRDEYYRSASSAPRLEHIRTPTVLMSSEDDPIVQAADLRRAKLSAQVTLHMEPHGGHLGYVSGHPTPAGSRHWLPYAVGHYISQLVQRSESA